MLAVALAIALGGVERAPGASTRILFGSCNRVEYPQPLWPHVLARAPDAWVWAGDNVYGDTVTPDWTRPGGLRTEPATAERLRALYAAQKAVPGYAALLRSNATILGTWDDHDYGHNDGDRTFPLRAASQRLALDFLGVPWHSERRFRAGVYGAHRLAGPRSADGRAGVLVVLLDVRSFRDPYADGPDGDMLGEAQWRWLEATLRRSRARSHVLVSGLQVLPAKGVGEGWARLPRARARLINLLHRLRVAAPLLLSGDVHMAELSAARCTAPRRRPSRRPRRAWPWQRPAAARARPAYPRGLEALFSTLRSLEAAYGGDEDEDEAGNGGGGGGGGGGGVRGAEVSGLVELTASGLTHAWAHRPLTSLVDGPRADLVFAGLLHLLQRTMPWRYQARGDGAGARAGHGGGYHLGLNFGQLDFDWDAADGPSVRLAAVGLDGAEPFARTWRLSELDLFGPGPRGGERAPRRDGDGREWTCRPLAGGAEMPSHVDLAVGFGCCAAQLLATLGLGLALARALARRALRRARAALGARQPPGAKARTSPPAGAVRAAQRAAAGLPAEPSPVSYSSPSPRGRKGGKLAAGKGSGGKS